RRLLASRENRISRWGQRADSLRLLDGVTLFGCNSCTTGALTSELKICLSDPLRAFPTALRTTTWQPLHSQSASLHFQPPTFGHGCIFSHRTQGQSHVPQKPFPTALIFLPLVQLDPDFAKCRPIVPFVESRIALCGSSGGLTTA